MARVLLVPRTPSSVVRVLRVLLACIALAVATPATNGVLAADLGASIVAVRGCEAAPRPSRARVVYARPHAYPTGNDERELAAPRILRGARAVRVRRTFLVNCSLLC
jgi:hypothetical protein